jgi:hypothetical protein
MKGFCLNMLVVFGLSCFVMASAMCLAEESAPNCPPQCQQGAATCGVVAPLDPMTQLPVCTALHCNQKTIVACQPCHCDPLSWQGIWWCFCY